MTIQQVMSAAPATVAVFGAYGLDTCCGAHRRVDEAAAAAGLDSFTLCRELTAAIAART